jgi:tetratricopeptide (TPR) repeat protein
VAGDYASHPSGTLLLRALYAAGEAHLAASEVTEAINAFAVILHENPDDDLGACGHLIEIFLGQERPEGVIGLYRLGFTQGANLLDVVLASIRTGDLELTLSALLDALESIPETRAVLDLFSPSDEVEQGFASAYLNKRAAFWAETAGAVRVVHKMLSHPVVKRTLELMDELDKTSLDYPDADLAGSRAEMFKNLRDSKVRSAILASVIEG